MYIPEEILLVIFQYLDLKDLLSTFQVSTSWSRISRDPKLWQKIILTGKTIPLNIENFNLFISQLIKMSPSLTKFRIDEFTSRQICPHFIVKTLVEYCRKLRELELEIRGGVGLDILDLIARNCKKSLQSLNIGISSVETGLSSIGMFRNLKKLHFHIESWTDHKLLFVTKEQEDLYMTGILAIEGLEEMILEGVMKGFRMLARGIKEGKIRKLKCLALRYLLDIDKDDVVTIVNSLEQLEYMEIDDAHDIMAEIADVTDTLQLEFPQVMFTNFPHLQIQICIC